MRMKESSAQRLRASVAAAAETRFVSCCAPGKSGQNRPCHGCGFATVCFNVKSVLGKRHVK